MISSVSPRYIRRYKWAADGPVTTCKFREDPVMFGKSCFMTIAEVRSTVEHSIVQFDDPVCLHIDIVSEGGDDRDGGHTEPI